MHVALVQMWDLLVWQGKHPQAPVTVAAKPNYFSELDIKKTIENLLTDHPRFFASDQMLKSLMAGDITAMDRPYFCQVWPAAMLWMPGLATCAYHTVDQHQSANHTAYDESCSLLPHAVASIR